MARETYVLRNGELVPKHLASPLLTQNDGSNRADLAVPYIMRDLPAYQATNGEMIDGRVAHREYLKKNNLIELGNEMPKLETPAERMAKLRAAAGNVKADIAEAINKLETGYVPEPDVIVKADDIGIGATPDNATVFRHDAAISDT